LIIFYEGHRYVKSYEGFKELPLKEEEQSQIKDLGLTIMDTELYNGVYKIFEVYAYNGVIFYHGYSKDDLIEVGYLQRMEQYTLTISDMILKPIHKIDSWDSMLDYVHSTHVGQDSGDIIDGIIVQDRKLFKSYKVKPVRLNTVDCMLVWNQGLSCYYLYLRAKAGELIAAMKKHIKGDKFGMDMFNYNIKQLDFKESYNILYDIPYKANNYIFKPLANWDKTDQAKQYRQEEREQAMTIMSNMRKQPKKYHKTIIEMSYDGVRWIPLRERFDKKIPNSYAVGLDSFGLMFAPLEANKQEYFEKTIDQTPFNEDMIQSFKEVNQVARTVIFDRAIISNAHLNKCHDQHYHYTAIDLAGGRGGDLKRFVNAGVGNLIAIDADKDALVTYTVKIPKAKEAIVHIYPELTLKSRVPPMFNVIHGCLSSDNTSILAELNTRIEYMPKTVDFIVMNYALHYLCDCYPKLIELKRLMNETLNEDGIVVFSFYDGDSLVNNYSAITSFSNNTIRETNDKITLLDQDIEQSPVPCLDSLYWTQVKQILDPIHDGLIHDKDQSTPIRKHLTRVTVRFEEYDKNDVIEPVNGTTFFNITNLVNKEHESIDIKNKIYMMRVVYPTSYSDFDISFLVKKLDLVMNKKYELNGWINMPLPTIDSSGYRREPLVMSSYFKLFEDKFEIYDEFYPTQLPQTLSFLHNNNIKFVNKDYLDNIKTVVLKRRID
jgi:hypothetical protein